MASFTQAGLVAAQTTPILAVRRRDCLPRRRGISPQAGRALEILGHAIEYLTDEYVHAGGSFSADDPQLAAVQLLMAVNRKIYLECPEVPTLSVRFLALIHLHEA